MPALVTSQCHMQIGRRHGLSGLRQPIRRRECSPGGRRRRQTKTRELGARGVSPGSGTPLAKAGRNSPGDWGGAAGGGGAEVVVRRGVPGSAADHRRGRIAGAGREGGWGTCRTLRAAALAREALSLCSRRCCAHGTNWNVQTADCDVTKGPARLASPTGGAAANPMLRIPSPRLLHGSLASGSFPGIPTPILGAAARRSDCRKLGPPTPGRPTDLSKRRVPTPFYEVPIFLHSLRLSQRPHLSHCPSCPFTCILYPRPSIFTLFSTPHQVRAPPSSSPPFSLLSLFCLTFSAYAFAAFPPHFSSAGQA